MMLDNASVTTNHTMLNYLIPDSALPFSAYIAEARRLIAQRRPDLQRADAASAKRILDANSPFELRPHLPKPANQKIKYGALLIHGLLDCPFSLRDIGLQLQDQGILCRSILLPGHGTMPSDLLSVSYHDWIQTLRYGVANLREEVDQLFLVGYSTGAALSIFQALQDSNIAGIILLAPAVRIKAPVDIAVGWHYLKQWCQVNHNQWIYRHTEIDYAKYISIAFNPVKQVSLLTRVLRDLRRTHSFSCPVFLAVSREDETISSQRAMDFFSHHRNPRSKLLLYTSTDRKYPDSRIITRPSQYPDLHIKHFSHYAIPFAPSNQHYGETGDYPYAAHINNPHVIYGAYNRIEIDVCDWLYQKKWLKNKRAGLTYNPDFDFMAKEIVEFILAT